MICKPCGYKGDDKDFLRSGYYVCPKCGSLDIKIEKAGAAVVPPKNGNPKKAVAEAPKKPLEEYSPMNPPETAPSGKAAMTYGEILIRVWVTGPKDAEAAIVGPPNMPFPLLMVGCEHLMTMTAQKSKAGFEKALELLVEGAMSNKGKVLKNT